MNKRLTLGRTATVAALLVAFLSQVTWALAGTTGRLDGTVVAADSGAPIANANVIASSPSQTVSTQTDATGHFIFISLSPDTYSVSVEKSGYQAASTAGVTIFADATQTLALRMESALKTIAKVTSKSAGSLVKSGTTSDVYSVNAATQEKITGLGGGGGLNTAYSAIASVPGAFVPMNASGYFQTVHIRGGDFDQVGYELDGVPVNRSFDNYPSGSTSSLGQQELQVYTGANPANSEGQGLAGFINQVIKSGTYPGFAQATLGVGSPTFYHKAAIEAGGATPNRLFSYYIGIGGYNQDFRYVNNANAAGYTDLEPPLQPNGNGGYDLLPYQYSNLANINDRDIVVNFHFGIPHKRDGGRDDVQLLWDSGYLNNSFYSSTNDAGGAAYLAGIGFGVPSYVDGLQYNCNNVGATTTTLNPSCVSTYFFPSSPTNRAPGAAIPANARDNFVNNQQIVKLQYQKNFGTDAYLRVYGYTYYSDWLNNSPQCAFANYICAASIDYELNSHTRGFSGQFSKQINPDNLLSLQASYTTATSIRDNNTQMFNTGGTRGDGIVMVNADAPYSGYCFDPTGTATSCAPGGAANFTTWKQLQGAQSGGALPALAGSCNIPGGTAGPCTWLIAESSQWATYNNVRPTFMAYSLTDEYRPNDKLLFNLGLRLDQYQFHGGDTRPNDPARQFWFTAWNLDNCINGSGAPVSKSSLGLSPQNACPMGYTVGNLQNVSSVVQKYDILEPRLAMTYTLNPDTVVRLSAGKYAQPPDTAFEQYDTLQEDSPFTLLGTAFYKFGFTTPSHDVRPPTSLNYDVSLEKHFKGTDWSFKLTPFLRKTKDQIQNFFLDQATGFISGLNVGRQTSEGVEFQLDKGDFNRNGLSGELSFAYTHSYINYDTLSNGSTVVTGINNDIASYNHLTKGGGGAACYQPTNLGGNAANAPNPLAGQPDPTCAAAGTVANPYYNAPVQSMIDSSANFPTYSLFPGPIGSSAAAFGAPYTATLVLNYKHDKFAITPAMQFIGGQRYGAPETTTGIDPTQCNSLTSAIAGDPRYNYGAAGGNPYDAHNCATLSGAIPNQFTGKFDQLGAFLEPNWILGSLQLSYDVSPKVSLVGTFTNLVNRCWGGTKAAWTLNDPNVCSYNILNNAGAFGPRGNVYNPGDPAAQRLVAYPYGAFLAGLNDNGNSTKMPFNFFLEARIKL